MHRIRTRLTLCTAVLLLSAACGDATGPGASAPAPAPPPPAGSVQGGERVMNAITCRANARTGDVVCGDPTPTLDVAADRRTLGDPDHFALIVHSATRNTSTQTGLHTVSIRNDIGQTIGTFDAEYPDTLRIFIVDGPTTTAGSGTVTVSNATGTGNLTGPGQPYFELEEMVAPGNQTSTFGIGFDLPNTVDEFTYTVMVSAPVRHPDGWIDLTGPTFLTQGTSTPISATVYEWTGVVNDTTWLSWWSYTPSVVVLTGEAGTHQFMAVAVSPGDTWSRVATSKVHKDKFYVVF